METIEERVLTLEIQQKRMLSDIESEKRTRSRSNDYMEARLRDVEKANWKSTGALAVFMVVLQIAVTLIAKLIH